MSKKLSFDEQAIVSASDSGLHTTTITLARKWLATDPDNLRVLIDLGHACWQLARYDEALTALTRAAEICEENKRDVIYGELGNLHRARGDFPTASKWFEKQIATDSQDATGYLFLGSLQMRQGDLTHATETLQRGLQCEYGCLDEVHLTLGIVFAAEEKYTNAAQQFEQALAIDPKNIAAKTALKDVRSATKVSQPEK